MSGFLDLFSDVASAYRAFRPAYPPALAEWLGAQAPGRSCAWDAGCGSGQFSGTLAGVFERVIATDASPQQLAQAAPIAGVEFRCAPAENSGMPAACADLVAAAQAAHWFRLAAFYAEARRVGRPGALLALVCYGRCELGPELDEMVNHYAAVTAGPHWPPERAAVDALYRDLDFPFTEVPAPSFALEEHWDLPRFAGYLGTWSATQRLLAAGGRPVLDGLRVRLARAWGDPRTVRRIRWPLGLRAGRIA